jgi:electron transport complex protein RnfC
MRRPIVRAPVPLQVLIPLVQHAGEQAEPLIHAGDFVDTGEPVARYRHGTLVHASIAGKVLSIEPRPVPGLEPANAPCVVIRGDGTDRLHHGCRPVENAMQLSPEEIRRRIAEAGVAGLGGALFPTAAKLAAGGAPVHALILNGAECEPWISCDEMLLRERAATVLDGARLMMRALETRHAVIVVESNMPEARVAIDDALRATSEQHIVLAVVTAKYPAGGERQLIELITGEQVPAGALPRDIGFVCQNVGTAAAVATALFEGRPLISRVVTVTGGAVSEPGNFEVRIGTPIADLVSLAGGYQKQPARLIMGGPMMGYALADDGLPVTKATNCIVAALPGEIAAARPEMPCIRCGDCVQACPAGLSPLDLLTAERHDDVRRLGDLGLADCIECGCCDFVCPSAIALTARFVRARHRHGLRHPGQGDAS